MNIQKHTYTQIDSIAVVPGNVISLLILKTRKEGLPLTTYFLYDKREGDGLTKLHINGTRVDRWTLLKWFSITKVTSVEVSIDLDRYGHTVGVNFSG